MIEKLIQTFLNSPSLKLMIVFIFISFLFNFSSLPSLPPFASVYSESIQQETKPHHIQSQASYVGQQQQQQHQQQPNKVVAKASGHFANNQIE